MTPDVNVLVAASRRDHVHHAVAHGWLTQALIDAAQAANGPPALRLMGTVVASYLRLVTHPKVFVTPTPIAQAIAFADALLKHPGVQWLPTGSEWPTLRQLCADQNLSGNDLPDAWIASITLQHQEKLVTFDRDFLRLLSAPHLHLLPTD